MAGCCQTSITDVLLGETACCGLHSLRVRPLSCTASSSEIELTFFSPLHIVMILQIYAVFLCKIDKEIKDAIFC